MSNVMLKYTEILEGYLFAFACILLHEDFTPIDGALLPNPLPALYTLL